MQQYKFTAYIFLLPTLIGLLVFRLLPVILSFFASFTHWDIISAPKWAGLSNYVRLLNSAQFWMILRNTFIFALLFTAGAVVIGLLFAVLLNEQMRGIRFFRGLFFLPYITPIVAVGIIWNWILTPQYGVLNQVIGQIFHSDFQVSWLGDSQYALYALISVYLWKTVGYQMMLYLSGLQHVPAEMREAARVDGAGAVRSFFSVTLPMITPTIFFVIVITIIESMSLQTFGITYIMTQGGPNGATTTLPYYIYQNAFVFYHMGYASSLTYILFVLTLLVTWLNFSLKKRWVNYL